LSANQIYENVSTSAKWDEIGSVYDEENNYCAQTLANKAYPVVAVMKGVDHGHIALVIPGSSTRSSGWNMYVANSASFFIGRPDMVYVGGPLSKVFGPANAQQALFFYRKS
jgi:hypothetical protein